MMNILIVEDERPALERLRAGLLRYDPNVNIVATTGSVRETVAWLDANRRPDLVLLDIQLSDGLSLEIFRRRPIDCPVIFITAHDEYLMEALACNGIDYLLKPVAQERLESALNKYRRLQTHFTANYAALLESLRTGRERHRSRFLVRKGIDFMTVKADEVAYFHTTHKVVFLVDVAGMKYMVDRALADLEEEVDPASFFRLNRKYLAHINAVARFKPQPKGKIAVELHPPVEEEVIISQERAAAFREWVGG